MNLQFDQARLEEICRKNGVEFLGVFGSVARGEAGSNSDVDILIRYPKSSRATLLDMVNMEEELGQLLGGKKVDLVTESFLSPYIRPNALRDLKPVYGTI